MAHKASLIRSADLKHHVDQGAAWLADSAGGLNTSALGYAAFEFRLAIERLAVEYWRQLLGRELKKNDLKTMHSFKTVEHRIYELGGNQKAINKHFEFMRLLLDVLNIKVALPTPNIGKMSKHWHDCSELCHILWTFASTDAQICFKAFEDVSEIRDILILQTSGLISWGRVDSPALKEIRDRFMKGKANADDVRTYFETTGAWAALKYNDGRPAEFIGEPISPISSQDT